LNSPDWTKNLPVVHLRYDGVEIGRVGPIFGIATRVTGREVATVCAILDGVCWNAEMLHVCGSFENGGCQACFNVPFDVAMDCETLLLADAQGEL
jgi:hypothetical protein